jgi:hypothetical protein
MRFIQGGTMVTEDIVLADRDLLRDELMTVFDAQTAQTLLSVLNKVVKQVYSAAISREDFIDLKRLIAEVKETNQRIALQIEEMQRQNERRFDRIESDIEVLKDDVKILKDDVGRLKGDSLENKYQNNAPAYFGTLLRRPKVVDVNTLWDELETHLSLEEMNNVLVLDLIVKGKIRKQPDLGEHYLAIEISSVMDKNDVQRAHQRAELLRRAGLRAIPVIAGEKMTEGAQEEARNQGVVVLKNGGCSLWDEALSFWVKNSSS